ncbi:MAG: class I SAM-dependent methyltransferase [Rhizobiales bacterium]|nr:class I SAM-dependent methyltransferase [Hyphomicrobiales bacterium]
MNVIVRNRTPAEVYDSLFVPALFQQWGPIVAEAARIKHGEDVLDVACGTGVAALAARERVGSTGKVCALDANADMLMVARRKSTEIDWREGKAEMLPFADQSFDAVISQFGLMFFDDRPAAFREMMRVLKPGGRIAVAVCDALDHSPGYAAFAQLLQRLFGQRVVEAFRAPFVLGDAESLLAITTAAGISGAEVRRHMGSVRFSSITSLVSTERACVWTLGGILDDAQFDRLLKESRTALKPYTQQDDQIIFDLPVLIVTASKA